MSIEKKFKFKKGHSVIRLIIEKITKFLYNKSR